MTASIVTQPRSEIKREDFTTFTLQTGGNDGLAQHDMLECIELVDAFKKMAANRPIVFAWFMLTLWVGFGKNLVEASTKAVAS